MLIHSCVHFANEKEAGLAQIDGERAEMRRLQYHRYGGPEVMRLEAFELPPPAAGEVAVKVRFAAVNPIDWKLRNGQMKIVTGNAFPRAMGMDFAGTVIAVGEGVTRFAPGDPVFGLAPFKQTGALSEGVIAKASALARKPNEVSFEDAACLGTAGVTAWNGLVDKAGVTAGHHVFVNGCAGAVGQAAVQIARMHGARVSGSCSARDIDRARQLGVETVLDYRASDPADIAARFDIVYDTAASMTVAEGLALLRKGGVFVDLNPSPGKFLAAAFNRHLKLVVCTPRPEVLDALARAAAGANFRLPIGEIAPLGDAIDLMSALEQGRKLGGKAVIRMD